MATQTNGERINYLEVIGKTGALYGMESLNPFLVSYTKMYSIRIKDLNVKEENYKLVEENVGEYPSNLEVRNDFLEKTAKVQNIKRKKNS